MISFRRLDIQRLKRRIKEMEKDQSTSPEHVSSGEQNKEQLEKVSDSITMQLVLILLLLYRTWRLLLKKETSWGKNLHRYAMVYQIPCLIRHKPSWLSGHVFWILTRNASFSRKARSSWRQLCHKEQGVLPRMQLHCVNMKRSKPRSRIDWIVWKTLPRCNYMISIGCLWKPIIFMVSIVMAA